MKLFMTMLDCGPMWRVMMCGGCLHMMRVCVVLRMARVCMEAHVRAFPRLRGIAMRVCEHIADVVRCLQQE